VEEANDVSLLRLVIVAIDLRAHLHFLDHHVGLFLAGLPLPHGLLVLVLAVVHDADDGRIGQGRNLNEVEILFDRHLERLLRGQDAHLGAVGPDDANPRDPDPVVYTWFILSDTYLLPTGTRTREKADDAKARTSSAVQADCTSIRTPSSNRAFTDHRASGGEGQPSTPSWRQLRETSITACRWRMRSATKIRPDPVPGS
jgi:hypothetical protein